MANTSNGVLYGVFAFSALMAGSVLNTLGPRLTMMFGITGYPLYIGAMWYYDTYSKLWYPIVAGAYLGLTAGCLWTTAAYTANAYAEEKDKGLYRAIQWTSNITGSAIGASVALGLSWNATSLSVPHSVYITFIIIQCLSVSMAFLLLPPDQLRRSDGTALASFEKITLWESLKMTGRLFKDWRIVLMIPTFFIPEMFFPFQSSMNAYAFNLRTRTLNCLLNNLIQIPTTMIMGLLLDSPKIKSRKKRAILGITFDAVWITAAYIAQTIWLASWKFDRKIAGPSIDCTDPAYAGAIVIYMVYAAQYGMFQNVVVYVMGTLTNDPYMSASIAGLFVACTSSPAKLYQSLKMHQRTYSLPPSRLSTGTAVSFGVDATEQPYENENAAYFALTTLCWPILYFVAWKYTSDTNYFKEETVIAPLHVRPDKAIEGAGSSHGDAEAQLPDTKNDL